MPNDVFILVTSDSSGINGKALSAFQICKERLSKSKWPIFSKTRNRNEFKSGDICVLYLAGKMKFPQHFIAIAEIEGVKKWDYGMDPIDNPDWLLENPIKFLALKKMYLFEQALPIQPFLYEFSFIPKNKSRWGVCFMGGARKLVKTDIQLIKKKLDPEARKIFSL